MQLLVGLATEVCRAFNKSLGDNLFQGLIMIIFGTFSKTARLDGGGSWVFLLINFIIKKFS